LEASKNTFKDKLLFLLDFSIKSMYQLKEYYKMLVEQNGVEVIFLDYIQLFSDSRNRNREQEIASFMRNIKEIAKELNVCIFLASQLSRSVETRGGEKRPILSDLRESGAIEEFADKVFFIYRPEYYGLLINEEGESTINQVELIIAKNNLFMTHIVALERDANFTCFDLKPTPQTELTWNYKIDNL
jgi:replicative DNA helicase